MPCKNMFSTDLQCWRVKFGGIYRKLSTKLSIIVVVVVAATVSDNFRYKISRKFRAMFARLSGINDLFKGFCFCAKALNFLLQLFTTFKALLNKADEWAVDGKKRKQMKAYCASFH